MFLNQASYLNRLKNLDITTGLQGDDYGETCRSLGAGLQWFDALELHDPKVAQLLCKLIPARCPLREKSSSLTTLYIPPLCQLNPLRASGWPTLQGSPLLADECGEDVAILLTARRNECLNTSEN